MIDTVVQSIVSRWNSPLNLYKDFAPQDAVYPFCTFTVNPAGMERTFCSDIESFSVIFTIWTQSKSSTEAQTNLNLIKTRYNRQSISGLVYIKLMSDLLVKDEGSHFYTGSSTYLVAVEETV